MNSAEKSEVQRRHHQAMGLCDSAVAARASGDAKRATTLFRRALGFEKRAAEEVVAKTPKLEPTRSVLLRSAAALAMECGEHREAERLIATALAGDPPDEIAEELRDLLERVNLARHVKKKSGDDRARKQGDKPVSIIGELRFANSTTTKRQTIKIVDSEGAEHTLIVADGMMADIVKPLWEERVLATGVERRGRIRLKHIERAPG